MKKKDYFEKLAEENAVYFIKVAEVAVVGDREKLRRYEDEDFLIDNYRIIGFAVKQKIRRSELEEENKVERIYRVEFPIVETRLRCLKRLKRLVGDMRRDGLDAYITAKPETQEVYPEFYPKGAEQKLLERHRDEYNKLTEIADLICEEYTFDMYEAEECVGKIIRGDRAERIMYSEDSHVIVDLETCKEIEKPICLGCSGYPPESPFEDDRDYTVFRREDWKEIKKEIDEARKKVLMENMKRVRNRPKSR